MHGGRTISKTGIWLGGRWEKIIHRTMGEGHE